MDEMIPILKTPKSFIVYVDHLFVLKVRSMINLKQGNHSRLVGWDDFLFFMSEGVCYQNWIKYVFFRH